MPKKMIVVLLALVIAAGVVGACFAYSAFDSRTIYEESTAHLVEIFHQANQTLYNIVSVNWSRMRMWVPYFEIAQSEEDIVRYVNRAKENSNFTNFFFISRNGDYLTLDGQRGYLDLRDKLEKLIVEQHPIVANSVVPDKSEIMVFATPAAHGFFLGFEYEAVAITYNNSDLVDALKISAFGGRAGTYAVLPDGRVVVDNGSEELRNIHNFFALLEKTENTTDEQIEQLEKDFLSGNSGDMVFKVNGRDYYLVYESANFQDWMVLGIVPTNVVNASMSKLQTTTLVVVSTVMIALALGLLYFVVQHSRIILKRKDNELLARDELFSKLSANVDDVFLMLDAENLRVDYVSPNIERLLGIPAARVRKEIRVLEELLKDKNAPKVIDNIAELTPGGQLEWEREYIHRSSGEVRWFHLIAFCSAIQGAKKYILDLSDRTGDKKINQELEDAVRIARHASLAKTSFLNNISHEIRTPMNAIIGYTDIAFKQNTIPEVRACLERISQSSEHLLNLINDVLDISFIESGKIQFNPVPADIT